MSIGKGESNTVQIGDFIGDAASWDIGRKGDHEASYFKRLEIGFTRITKNGATLPKLKEHLKAEIWIPRSAGSAINHANPINVVGE